MDTHTLKQRIKLDEPTPTTTTSTTPTTDTTTTTTTTTKSRRENKMVMAKKGLKSLAIALTIPLSLTTITLYLFGTNQNYYKSILSSSKPIWFPPLWALNLCCLGSSMLMGLSSWLVWAEGGFHRKPTFIPPLCLTQLVLSLCWKPVVYWMGANRLGLTICIAEFGTLVGCMRVFRGVNPIASDLVKPCLAWVAFLSVINYKLLYMSS